MGEGSASVACGCDISRACAGIQTDENWPDTAAAAAAAAAAAETIEELQQELVGGDAGSTERHSSHSCQVHWVTLNDEYSQLLNVRLSGT
jgi:hypothetical protein